MYRIATDLTIELMVLSDNATRVTKLWKGLIYKTKREEEGEEQRDPGLDTL